MTPKNNRDEDTRIFNHNSSEETALDNQPAPVAGGVPPKYSKPTKKAGYSTGAKVAAAIGGGIFIGGIAALATSMAPNPDSAEPEPEEPETNPDWLAGDLKVASGVNDDMSFEEAFAAARAEVGPGGAFEWHGGVYGTYTAAEWNSMSAADRAEWSSNFDWNHVDAQAQPQHVTHVTEHVVVEHHVHTNSHDKLSENVGPKPGPTPQPEKEFEVLGVVHDDDNNTNIGLIKVNGQEAFVIDVDNDLKFDLMAYDQNHDGQITEDEFIDISGGNLTVASLGGFTESPVASDMAQTEVDSGVDYTQTRGLAENQEAEVTDNNSEATDNNEVEITAHSEATGNVEADGLAEVSYTENPIPVETENPDVVDAQAHAQVEYVQAGDYASAEAVPAEGEVIDTTAMVDVTATEYNSTENLTAQYEPEEIPVEDMPIEDVPTIDQDIASADDILNIHDDSFDNSHLA